MCASTNVKIELRDINGRVVLASDLLKAVNHTHQLDVSHLRDGLYFMNMGNKKSGGLVRSFKPGIVIRKSITSINHFKTDT